jgi:hypothetical protein
MVLAVIDLDDTSNNVLTNGLLTVTIHEARCGPFNALIGCVFVLVVAESKTVHIYNVVLCTIKAVA